MKKKIICPLCKSSQFQKISDNVRYNTGQKVFKCIKCEIIFNTPFVDTNFYKSDFRKMYETIPSPKYIYNNSIDEANNRFNRFKNLIKNQSTILEIGCSCGNFLELFQQKNTKVIGIEPSIENRKFLRKIGISAFPDIADIKDSIKFDLIFMFHVLEHIEEPIEYLYNLKKYMHKNSKLIIEVPNVDDILIKFYKINEFFNFYWQPAHNFYFNKKTLKFILDKSGLNSKLFSIQRYDISNHISWLIYRKSGTKDEIKFFFNKSINNEYIKLLYKKNMTDTIYAICNL